MSSFNQLGTIASGILQYEQSYITGGVEQGVELVIISGNLSGLVGELNTLTNQNFCFSGEDVSPVIRSEEKSILKELYLRDYNSRQASKLLRGLYDASSSASIVGESEWTELRDGDTVIRRSPASSHTSAATRLGASKMFEGLARESRETIKDLVYKYNLYGAAPRQVAGADGYFILTPTPTPTPTPAPTTTTTTTTTTTAAP